MDLNGANLESHKHEIELLASEPARKKSNENKVEKAQKSERAESKHHNNSDPETTEPRVRTRAHSDARQLHITLDSSRADSSHPLPPESPRDPLAIPSSSSFPAIKAVFTIHLDNGTKKSFIVRDPNQQLSEVLTKFCDDRGM